MKMRRRNLMAFIITLFLLLCLLKLHGILSSHSDNVRLQETDLSTDFSTNSLNACPIPNYYDVSHSKSIVLSNLKCPENPDNVFIENGFVRMHKKTSCSYRCVMWKSDFDFVETNSKFLKDNDVTPCSFMKVNCDGFDEQIVITAVRNETLIKRCKDVAKTATKLRDVVIIGVDSLSYQAWKAYLPKTFETFHSKLNGVSFKKFNTMGDGTTVNVQALLTGTKDTETFETRKRISGSRSVDDYNWIWKHYQRAGYVTFYMEDMTDYGTFQYRLNGFIEQPTDFYGRTVFMAAEKHKSYKHFCLKNVPYHQIMLNFLNDFHEQYADVPKFSFSFFGLLSHDDNKYASYMDDSLAAYILQVRKNNPDSILVLYSDHGHRFFSRLTMQGKYEERLPFFGISLPAVMATERRVLLENADILTSALDAHATLEDILGIYKSDDSGRHLSLLRPLSKSRSCKDIQSAPHWCACLNWRKVVNPSENQLIMDITKNVVDQIVTFSKAHRDLCAELKLDQILSVYAMEANKAVLMFKQSADVDGFVPDLSDKTQQMNDWFRITFQTIPGDAIFELTVGVNRQDFDKNKPINIQPNEVSRINRYAPWIKCLSHLKTENAMVLDIRKFCICKNLF